MSKNLLNKLFDRTNKIYKENHQTNNNKFKEKIICFSFGKDGEFSQNFEFESSGKIVEILINFSCDNDAKIEVNFNGVLIQKNTINSYGQFNYFLYAKNENILKLNIVSNEGKFVDVLINVKGEVEKVQKSLSKLLYLNNLFYLQNNNILSQNNNILSLNYGNNNIITDNSDNYIDTNYAFENDTFLKHNIYCIYYDNTLKLKNLVNNIEYSIGYDTRIASIVSSKIEGKNLAIFYNLNNSIFVNYYSADFILTGTYNLNGFNGKNLIELGSIISDQIVDYFIAKDTYNLWYFVEYNFELNEVKKITPFDKCNDLKVYYNNDQVICIEKVEKGIILKIFSDFELTNKIYEQQFFNVYDAVYFENVLYLINQNNVQLVEL